MSAPQSVIHVISHTHWDREWHQSFQGFRRRLVGLLDYLLELLAARPDYLYYHLDGQTCPLRDYLTIRRERAEELRDHILSGRILIGPFYILPDEFLVSGEATVRNLLLGYREAQRWGVRPMKVGYLPDTFGHISQMPQILRGFGIDNAVLFRGVTYDQVRSEFLWEAPDGTQVLCLKMPDELAYSNLYYEAEALIGGPDEAVDPEAAVECVARLKQEAQAHATTRHLLAMDGVDHIYPSAKTLDIIEAAGAGLTGTEVIHSSLPAYVEAVKVEARDLDVWSGEMRTANRAFRLQALLAGTLSSWMPLKQLNWECQTELERWAEPMTALAGMLGADMGGERGFLREAWRQLLINHPHDSICGCSIDEVHEDMLYRFRQSLQLARATTRRGMEIIAEQVDTSWVPEGAEAVVVLNPLGWARRDVVFAEIDFPAERNVQWFRLRDAEGKEVPLQRIGAEQRHFLSQAPHDIPRGRAVTRHQVAFVADVPGLGYTVLAAVPEAGPIREQLPLRGCRPAETEEGAHLPGLRLEDGGDVGDGYNYVPPERDALVAITAGTRVLEACGPVFRRERWECRVGVPRAATQDLKGRSEERVELPVTVWRTQVHGLPGTFYRLEVDNGVRDHRLRVVFRFELPRFKMRHFAESQFDIVDRPTELPDTSDWREEQPPFWPQQSFCGLEPQTSRTGQWLESRGVPDVGAGTAWVANRGLPEYEIRAPGDAPAEVAVTLLRCIGRGVGQPEQFVQSQLQGRHTFELATFSVEQRFARAPWIGAHNFNVPLRICQTGRHGGDLPPRASFIKLTPEELAVTALKPAEERESVILRVANYGPEADLTVASAVPTWAVYRCNLAEERLTSVTEDHLPMRAKEIVSIELCY